MSDHRHATDRVDGVIIAECPNKQHEDDGHLLVEADYGMCANDELADKILESIPNSCGACGEKVDYIRHQEPSEVLN